MKSTAPVRRLVERYVPARMVNFWCHVMEGAFASFGEELVGGQVFVTLVAALGGSATDLGLLMSVSSFGFLVPFLLAPRLEAVRRKKRLVLALGFVSRLGFPLTVLVLALLARPAPLTCLYTVAVVQLLASVPGSMLTAPWMDLLAETIPHDRLGRLFGFRHVLSSLLALGSAGACWALIKGVAFPLNYELLYLLAFASMAGSLLIFSRVDEIPESVPSPARKRARHYFRELLAALGTDRNYVLQLCHKAMGRLVMVTPFFALAAIQVHGLGKAEIAGLSIAAAAVGKIGGNLVFPFVGERIGAKRLLGLGDVLRTAAALVAMLALSGYWFIGVFFLVGLNSAASTIGSAPFRMQIFPRGKRVGYIALSSVVLWPLGAIAPPIAGLIVYWFGYSVLFGASAATALLALVPLWMCRPRAAGASRDPGDNDGSAPPRCEGADAPGLERRE